MHCSPNLKNLPETVPRALDAIADIVLAYKPKPKSKRARSGNGAAMKIALQKQSVVLDPRS